VIWAKIIFEIYLLTFSVLNDHRHAIRSYLLSTLLQT
jgi:hypothetical protein